MKTIKDTIISKLKKIERTERVKILYAVESGSRGWGFESRDSDYDVRFIYAHSLGWYLSIEDKKDVIEYPISDRLDISGWDIKKTLRLFKKSNPPLYEWLNPPIIYLEQRDFVQKLRELMPKFYSTISAIHHYFHMAQGNYRAYLMGKKIKVKKYFYVLRPIFACLWIESEKSMPHMEFEKLLITQKASKELISEIRKLLKRKRSGIELGTENRIEVINEFIEEKLMYFENYIKTLTFKHHLKDNSLDKLFGKIVKNISV